MEVWARLAELLEAKEGNLHGFMVRLLTAVARDPDNHHCMEAFADLSFESRGRLGDEIQKVSIHERPSPGYSS